MIFLNILIFGQFISQLSDILVLRIFVQLAKKLDRNTEMLDEEK